MLELEAARLVVLLFEAYLALGLAVALPFVFVRALGGRVDPGLAASGLGFRLLLVPGCTLLWPWLVRAIARGAGEPPNERNAHRPRPTR